MLPHSPQELVSSPGVPQVITKEVTNIPDHMFPFLQANDSLASTAQIDYIFERTRELISVRGKTSSVLAGVQVIERAVEKLGKKLVKRTISSVPASQHHLLTDKALFEKGRCIVSKSKYPLNEIVVWCEAGRESDVQRAITEVGKSQYTSTYSAALRSGIKQYISRPEFPEDIMADNEGLERCYVPVHLADPGKSNLNIDFAGTREAVDAAFVQVVDLLERVKVSTLEIPENLPPERLAPLYKQRSDEFYETYNVIICPEPSKTSLIFDPITALGRKRFTKRHEYLQKAREILALDKAQNLLDVSCEQSDAANQPSGDPAEPARKRRKLDSPGVSEAQSPVQALVGPSELPTERSSDATCAGSAIPIKNSTNTSGGTTKIVISAQGQPPATQVAPNSMVSHRGLDPPLSSPGASTTRPQSSVRHSLPPKPVLINNLDNAGARLDVKNKTLEQANEALQKTVDAMKSELSRFQTTAEELLQKNRSLENSNASLSELNTSLSIEISTLRKTGGQNKADVNGTHMATSGDRGSVKEERAVNAPLASDLIVPITGLYQVGSLADNYLGEIQTLRNRLSEMHLELQTVKKKAVDDVIALEAEKAALQTELNDARTEIQDLTTMYDAGEAYRQELFQDLEAARKALSDAGNSGS